MRRKLHRPVFGMQRWSGQAWRTCSPISQRILDDPNATPEERSVAGSDLAQSRTDDHTSERVASEAGQLLDDKNISEADRSVAGSDLSQRAGSEE